MTEFLTATVAFVASHVIVAYKPIRNAAAARVGERWFLAGYGILSTVLVVWLFRAYFATPYIEVWPFQEWMRWVPVLVMPFACILVVAGLTTPNPLSLGAGSKGYDPVRPGIVAVTRHPAIWGLTLWAAAHLVANGDLASVIMFGLLIALGLYGPVSLDAKRRAALGDAEWRRLAAGTSNWPLAAVVAGRARFRPAEIGWSRLAGGLALYAFLFWAHAWVIGVAPLP
jgi:uncharacterized membrane protein